MTTAATAAWEGDTGNPVSATVLGLYGRGRGGAGTHRQGALCRLLPRENSEGSRQEAACRADGSSAPAAPALTGPEPCAPHRLLGAA